MYRERERYMYMYMCIYIYIYIYYTHIEREREISERGRRATRQSDSQAADSRRDEVLFMFVYGCCLRCFRLCVVYHCVCIHGLLYYRTVRRCGCPARVAWGRLASRHIVSCRCRI